MDIKLFYKIIYNNFYFLWQMLQREIKFIINFVYKKQSNFLYATTTLPYCPVWTEIVAKSLHRPVARNGIKTMLP